MNFPSLACRGGVLLHHKPHKQKQFIWHLKVHGSQNEHAMNLKLNQTAFSWVVPIPNQDCQIQVFKKSDSATKFRRFGSVIVSQPHLVHKLVVRTKCKEQDNISYY